MVTHRPSSAHAAPVLSFDRAPPISVPFRLFLTAPLFGALAGALLLWQGSAALSSRWTPATLALVHLMMAGCMLQVMSGALLQFVPVVTGGNVMRPGRLVALVHPALAAGALVLAAAFLFGQGSLFLLAAVLLGSGGTVLAVAVGVALWQATALGPTLVNLRLAVTALLVTVGLGVLLARGMSGRMDLPMVSLANAHAVWGLGGWSLSLLAGVSCVVVPMFQMTKSYPPPAVRSVRWLTGAALATSLLPLVSRVPAGLAVLLAFAAGTAYALTTLRLQAQRRRRVTDHVLQLFRLGMISLLAAVLLTLGVLLLAPEDGRWIVLIGVLVIHGLYFSTVQGMLYKIAPFLVWLHLQALPGMKGNDKAGGKAVERPLPPDMNRMIPPPWARAQRGLQGLTLGALLFAPWFDPAARLGGVLLVASSVLLWASLGRATGVYRRFSQAVRSRIPSAAAPTEC